MPAWQQKGRSWWRNHPTLRAQICRPCPWIQRRRPPECYCQGPWSSLCHSGPFQWRYSYNYVYKCLLCFKRECCGRGRMCLGCFYGGLLFIGCSMLRSQEDVTTILFIGCSRAAQLKHESTTRTPWLTIETGCLYLYPYLYVTTKASNDFFSQSKF